MQRVHRRPRTCADPSLLSLSPFPPLRLPVSRPDESPTSAICHSCLSLPPALPAALPPLLDARSDLAPPPCRARLTARSIDVERSARAPPRPPADWSSGTLTRSPRESIYIARDFCFPLSLSVCERACVARCRDATRDIYRNFHALGKMRSDFSSRVLLLPSPLPPPVSPTWGIIEQRGGTLLADFMFDLI